MTEFPPRLTTALSDRYRIEGELGEGGMATVYLAQDLKHDRQVALKVLKPELAAVVGAERFLSEIRTTAHLQHPNILPLFDSGEVDGQLFYVMPYVEGESLRERLDRERQLPVDEAVRIAAEVAEALGAAHDDGIIHRDIKPANILLRKGKPLVADFGIALAVSAAGAGRLTETGLSLGTPYYMSPEQASADRDPDARSDIYSLGCVLYEMLTGEPPFPGSSAQAVLGRILTGEPTAPTVHRRNIPPNVEAAILKAIEKLPADRFGSAADFAKALSDPGFRHASGLGAASAGAAGSSSRAWIGRLGWIAALVFAVGWGVSKVRKPSETSEVSDVRRYQILLPDSLPLTFRGPAPLGIWQSSLALSRDGSTLAWVAPVGETTRLFLRDMEDGSYSAVSGSDGAYSPFFSPDGQWLGFFTGSEVSELKKVSVSGGQPVELGTYNNPEGAVWTEDDQILVADREGFDPILAPAAGGPRRSLAAGQPYALGKAPDLLPDGRWAVVSMQTGQLALLSLESREVLALTRRGPIPPDSVSPAEMLLGFDPQYVSSGHLLYLSSGDGVMMALPFDGQTLEVLGDPVPVLEDVRKEETHGLGHFAVARDGTLVYAPGVNAHRGYLGAVDTAGVVDTLRFPRDQYDWLALSPDGKKLLTARRPDEGGATATYLLDLESGQSRKLSIDENLSISAWFWFDNDRFLLHRADPVTQALFGLSEYSLSDASLRPIVNSTFNWPAVHPDGNQIVVSHRPGGEISVISREDGSTLREIPDVGYHHAISPNGRWHAFYNEGKIFIATFPYSGLPHQVAEGPAEQPRWSADGRALFFRGAREFWRVSIEEDGDGGLRIGVPRRVAEGPFSRVWAWAYDLTPDDRILTVIGPPERSTGHLEVVSGFFTELNLKAPSRR